MRSPGLGTGLRRAHTRFNKQIFMMQLNLKYVYVVRFHKRSHIGALKLIYINFFFFFQGLHFAVADHCRRHKIAVTSLLPFFREYRKLCACTHFPSIGIRAIDNKIIYALRSLIYCIKIDKIAIVFRPNASDRFSILNK